MQIFKKKEKQNKSPNKNKSLSVDSPSIKENKKFKKEKNKIKNQKAPKEIEFNKIDNEKQDILALQEETEIAEEEIDKEKDTKKKKPIIRKDMKGKPVYLEDTGEKLGTVFDTIYDKEKCIVGYKIKDEKSDAVLSFPFDQFDFDKNGLIFIPGWYTNAVKIIEKLEFKDKVSPELTALLSDDSVTINELYDIFVKHDDDMAKYIEDAISLNDLLNNRLKILTKQRLALKEDLIDLTEKRLIKDIDRREFSEDVMEHRRKANILDINIEKCKNLQKRLENTSFGIIGKNRLVTNSTYKTDNKEIFSESLANINLKDKVLKNKGSNLDQDNDYYKNKYYELKNQFEQLEDEYQELKIAVDKLLSREEL